MKQLRFSPQVWLVTRFAVFPLLIGASFFGVRWGTVHCWSSANGSSGLSVGGGPGVYSFLLWAAMIFFFGTLFMSPNLVDGYRKQKNFLRNQLLVTLASTALTVPLYFVLRMHSQAMFSPNWMCDSHGTLYGAQAPHTILGTGVTPGTLIFFVTIYLLAPVIQYGMDKTGRRVGGMKKRDLFQ
jgi:hypothetical protein